MKFIKLLLFSSHTVPYYNPAPYYIRNETYERITLLIESITNESKSIVESICSQILKNIELCKAKEYLTSLPYPKYVDTTPFSGGNNSNNV
jgi:hypothetical protein